MSKREKRKKEQNNIFIFVKFSYLDLNKNA